VFLNWRLSIDMSYRLRVIKGNTKKLQHFISATSWTGRWQCNHEQRGWDQKQKEAEIRRNDLCNYHSATWKRATAGYVTRKYIEGWYCEYHKELQLFKQFSDTIRVITQIYTADHIICPYQCTWITWFGYLIHPILDSFRSKICFLLVLQGSPFY